MLRTRGRTALSFSAALVATGLALCGAACASDKREVKVLLTEWHVEPKPTMVAAGKVQFVVENAGFVVHELIIVRGDDPDALPTDANGAVDEAHIAERDKVGHVENIAPHETTKMTFNLTSGEYILFCNIVDKADDGTKHGFSHFAERMVGTITVNKQ